MPIDRPKSPKPGRGTGRDGSMAAAGADPEGEQIVRRRHSEWAEHQIGWRRLLDSYEGGDRYRNAVYGMDRFGLPVRNLMRHRCEQPDPQRFPSSYPGFPGYVATVDGGVQAAAYDLAPGSFPGMLGADPFATAQDDDYEQRRSRTPPPGWVAEACSIHLGKIYDQEVSREGPADLTRWWEDCDGKGTPVDDWMRETIAPLLLVLGSLDVCLDHPAAPSGETVVTRADETRLGLDRCIASYILPENLVWWRLDAADRYEECLVREYVDPSDRDDYDDNGNAIDPEGKDDAAAGWRRNYIRYRHWRAGGWVLYGHDGDVLDRRAHPYGRVPIVRLIDQRKHRTRHIGTSRYEEVAALQREFYNRNSELILSDILQAAPLLSGPGDLINADHTVSVGIGNVLPKKKSPESGTYEGWEYVSPSKDPAASLRQNMLDLIDAKDRAACLAKPAGAVAGSTIAQSGVSKQLDAVTGHKLLSSVARSLAKAERTLAEYALLVLHNKPPDRVEDEGVTITYPAKFELFGAAELIDNLTKLQVTLQAAGEAPNTEREILQAIVRQTLLGLTDAEYAELDDEIELLVETKARLKGELAEGMGAAPGTGPGDGDDGDVEGLMSRAEQLVQELRSGATS